MSLSYTVQPRAGWALYMLTLCHISLQSAVVFCAIIVGFFSSFSFSIFGCILSCLPYCLLDLPVFVQSSWSAVLLLSVFLAYLYTFFFSFLAPLYTLCFINLFFAFTVFVPFLFSGLPYLLKWLEINSCALY